MEQLATDAQLRLVVREAWRDMRQRLAYLTGLPTLHKLSLVSWMAASDGQSLACNMSLECTALLSNALPEQLYGSCRCSARSLDAEPSLQVSTDWLPQCLYLLTQLRSLTWEGEGPFEDQPNEWTNALAALSQLTYLRWQPWKLLPGSPAQRDGQGRAG